MNQSEQNELRSDFLAWSGGFPPESEHQITVYLDYAASPNIRDDQADAREFLRSWRDADEI